MSELKEPILRIPETVREDTFAYRSGVKKYLDGETSEVAFRAYRVPMGIYEQRTVGKFMVRIRIGAGLAESHQLKRVAQLSNKYGNGILHVTTRQDIQIHEVNVEDTPDVLESLLEVGLSPRGGGGNTVRNVTACPGTGVCMNEKFNIAPYSIATAEYLLQERSSFNLPRKYKIVFSGCPEDCAFASVADLGFFAHNDNGGKGFAVYAGGGLGPNPAVAVKMEDFVPADEVLEVAEAVKRLFDKHGDRSNKHKARLRYVLKRIGIEEFVKLYQQERAVIKKEGLKGEIPEFRDVTAAYQKSGESNNGDVKITVNVLPEKTEGLFGVRLNLGLGDISADSLAKAADIADEFGTGLIRTTQLQNLLITSVRGSDIEKIKSALSGIGIDVSAIDKPKIVACAGASTCKLGLCLSRGLAEAISDKLGESQVTDKGREVVRISGCPNSCGHHFIADIGFEGKAKRIDGKLMPFYDVLAGAKTYEGQGKLAKRIGSIPAKRIPDFVAEVFAKDIKGGPLIELVKNYDISCGEVTDDYYYDYGASEAFSLAGRGPGECGAGVMDVMQVDIDEAKRAIKTASGAADSSEKSQSLYNAVVASARSLMIVFGLEPKKDREIFGAFTEHFIEPGWVKAETQKVLDQAVDWRMGDRDSIEQLAPEVKELAERVEELFLSLDASLKFKAEPFAQKKESTEAEAKSHLADLRGVGCPLNFVKAKLALEKIEVGEVLEVLVDDGEPVRNVPASFTEQGQEVLEVKNAGEHFSVKVLRKK